jgi:tRNA(fMet)-specific endonuclease VapC
VGESAVRFLLDTNAVSDLVRNPQGAVAARLAGEGEKSVCTSAVVACELRYGARKRGSRKLSEQLEKVLALLPQLPLSPDVAQRYAEIRVDLEGRGTPIGANDLLIAAHASALGLTLVSDNEREFGRVQGLGVQNWSR